MDEITEVFERSGNVDIRGVTCLLYVCIGAVNVKVDTVTVQVLQGAITGGVRRCTEGTYFHCVCNCCRFHWCGRVRVMELLGISSSVSVFV